MTDNRPTIVLGVTGCIAAYKAAELARTLMRADMRVKVVMTEAAQHFVGAATFRALTGEPVATTLWDDQASARVFHVSLAEEADVMVIAPATANTLAKLASGRADDLLSTTALATEAPLVIAPAMNVHMWRDEATRTNVETLRSRRAIVVEPESGELACGEVGEGRLADVETIATAVIAEARRTRDLEGVGVLVTAGGTQEPIDAVRFIGNRGSGKTGFAIAEEAARRGARVTLVAGPTELPDPFGVATVRVTTAAEMRDAVLGAYADADVVVASAAVADFRPKAASEAKIKKADGLASIELERTSDILAELGEDRGLRMLVGFAAETGDPVPSAQEKLERKGLDVVVANDVSVPGLGFASDRNRVTLVWHDRVENLHEMGKKQLARELWDRFAKRARAAHEERTHR
ncbi:MAG: bifunctional phosphopantothenoylcysteine decarboxylase/phosphopantothenate--cysteine ligase CoaBC [Coriobacteriales bacterium]|nr:bifunctional phosphopantothenoylcysteine decarboxylase/phosphopantothenate--cysteine ligase CoaBC [Coriobacteriales bacterium]